MSVDLSGAAGGTPTAAGDGTLSISYERLPLYKVEVDWDGDGTYANSNANVYNDIEYVSTYRGRSYGDMIYGRSEAGEMRLRLRNDDGKYDRFDPSSPLHGLAVPGRLARFSIRPPHSGIYQPQWGGSLWKVDLQPGPGGMNDVEITCYGPLIMLTQRRISSSMRTAISAANAAVAVLDAANVPASRRGTIAGNQTLARWWVSDELGIDALREIEETELGFVLETKQNQIAMQADDYRQSIAVRNAVLTLNADGTRDVPVAVAQPEDPLKDIANIIRIPVRTFIVGAQAALWTLRHTVAIEVGETMTFLAQYPTVGSPGEALGVDTWTAMAATIDYTANSDADGTGTDMTSVLTVTTNAATDLATSRVITVKNDGTGDLALTKLQTRGTPLTETEPTIIIVEDQDSIDEYEDRDYLVPSQFISTIRDAQSYGGFLIALLKDPLTRITVEFEASDYLTQVMELDLSDRVNLAMNDSLNEYFVEGIGMTLYRGGRLIVELLLSPTDIMGAVYILGATEPLLGDGILGR